MRQAPKSPPQKQPSSFELCSGGGYNGARTLKMWMYFMNKRIDDVLLHKKGEHEEQIYGNIIKSHVKLENSC